MSITSINNSFNLFARLFESRKATEPIIKWRSEKPLLTDEPVSSPLPRALPEETGIPSGVIADFLTELKNDPTLDMHTVLFVKNGAVIASAEFGEHSMGIPKYVFSASKSVTALAIGMLIDDGKLSMNEKLVDIFGDLTNTISKLRLRDVTVETLLTMRSCSIFNEVSSMTTPDWQSEFMNSLTRGTVNTDFNYNSLNTYMLAAIVRRKTGKGLVEYLTPRLFEPLDIKNIYWEKSPEGIEKGGWGLYIRPEDFAKIGLMVQNGGTWNGKRLISSAWLEQAVSPHATPPAECGDFNYGYQIWTGRRANTFLFNGMLGQNLLCFRSSGLIIVSNAGNDESFQQSNYFRYALKHFGKPFSASLQPDSAAVSRLESVIRDIKDPHFPAATGKQRLLSRLFARRQPTPLDSFLGVTFTVDDEVAPSTGLMPKMLQAFENNYSEGFVSFTIEKSSSEKDDEFIVTVVETDETHRFTAGENRYIRTGIDFHGQKYLVASAVRAAKDEDGFDVLTLDMLYLETPFRRRIRLTLGRTAGMEFTERPAEGFSVIGFKGVVDEFAKTPVIGSAAGLLENDIWRSVIKTTFTRTLHVIPDNT